MSRPFRFSMQKVLAYREQLEEQAKMAYARAQHEYARQVSAVDAIRRGMENLERSLHGEKPPTPDELWLARQYRERLKFDLRRAEQLMLERAKELNRCQRDLVAKSKDRKLLEKLKENLKARHVREEQHREQKEFDETATVRYRPETV
ncbi:MAG: flagellar export protein FliJ [Desulfovibrionaceae bacterium]|jgi:flagellar FliJ protein|nr:flagellar export protein FliJ [Desulfovibrionaceae bacterium]